MKASGGQKDSTPQIDARGEATVIGKTRSHRGLKAGRSLKSKKPPFLAESARKDGVTKIVR